MATEYRDSNHGLDGNGGDTGDVIDPANIGTAGTEPESAEQPRRRRKRSDAGQPRNGKPAARPGTAKALQKVALDLSALTGMFVGLHLLLAERTGTPELAITEEEGKSFMDAAQNVMRHYSVETTQKALDWTAFAGVAAGMYMPRVAAVGMRKRSAGKPRPAKQSPQNQGAQVVSIVPDMAGANGFQEG